jgi:hypothetical protein
MSLSLHEVGFTNSTKNKLPDLEFAMARKKISHSYAELCAFERLMLLVATIAYYPGIGYLHAHAPEQAQQSPLEEVRDYMQKIAFARGISLPEYSIPTLRKDLEWLKRYGILEQRRYRWGYYLGTGVMNRKDLQVALNVLESKAKYQQDPTANRVYRTILQRMHGSEQQQEILYPVRAQLNGSIIHTDPDELITKARYRHTLFHKLETVEQSILNGQAMQICQTRDPYESMGKGSKIVYPLQIIHYTNSWYLLYEQYKDRYLVIERFDRFDDNCKVIETEKRSLAAQRKSLDEAYKLLKAGWGMYLGQPEEQMLERSGKLDLVTVTARFFGKAVPFILEGDRRHHTQQIAKGPQLSNGEYEYVDYTVKLPPRAFTEFSYWIYRFVGKVKVLSPPELVEQHRQLLQQAHNLYS